MLIQDNFVSYIFTWFLINYNLQELIANQPKRQVNFLPVFFN
jgi:hypothetical protein